MNMKRSLSRCYLGTSRGAWRFGAIISTQPLEMIDTRLVFSRGATRAALAVVLTFFIHERELNSSGKGDLRPARRVRGRRGILTNKGTQYPSSDRLLIERTRSLNAGSAPF